MLELRVRRLRPSAVLPTRGSTDAAGLDLFADLDQDVVMEPGARARIPTGICLALPPEHEGQVRPRSGLAARHGVTVLNSPGTVDTDYRGEVQVVLINHGSEAFTVRAGARIAQLIVAPVCRVELVEVATLGDTPRGDGGFGSTGR